jgi:hypothetical protein
MSKLPKTSAEWKALQEDFSSLTLAMKKVFRAIALGVLEDLLYCNRVWAAWGYGTMTEGDFVKADEDYNILHQAECLVYLAYRQASQKQLQQKERELQELKRRLQMCESGK